jgi:phosphodiesterase/alkaline phosphatase D-like protein
MRNTRPDFFVHCGDPSMRLPDRPWQRLPNGQVEKHRDRREVKVAETLAEFRGT